MNTVCLVYKNGFLVKKFENVSVDTVINFCDEYATQNPNDWTTANVKGEQDFYVRCDNMNVREVK